MNAENILTWNAENWITVLVMVFLPWLVIGFIVAVMFGKTVQRGSHENG